MLRNLITDTEKESIKSYINTYAFSSAKVKMKCSVDELLRFWSRAKGEYLYSLLGNLTISKDVCTEKPMEEISYMVERELLSSFPEDACTEFIDSFNLDFSDSGLILNSSDNSLKWRVRTLTSARALAENKYTGDTFSIPTPEGKEIKVPTGCKISKILGKIAAAYKLKGWEEFRIKHSLVLNQKKLTGKLCLSIHPLDYMTMSDNDNDWTSCMSWKHFGGYRQGTVEMMNSPMVVVAYLAGSEDMNLVDGFKWNNKKWRELFIVNKDIITNIKAYPYKNNHLTRLSLNWLKELCDEKGFSQYNDHAFTWNGEYDEEEDYNYFESHKLRIDPSCDKMYNDFYAEAGQLSYLRTDLSGTVEFNYSGESECMCCGDIYDEVVDEDGESLLGCSKCEGVSKCSQCNCLTNRDNLYKVDGQQLCERCYNLLTFDDEVTGEPHLNRNSIIIKVFETPKDALPIEERPEIEKMHSSNAVGVIEEADVLASFKVYCSFKNLKRVSSIIAKKYIHKSPYFWYNIYYLFADELTDKGAEILGYKDQKDFLENCKHED